MFTKKVSVFVTLFVIPFSLSYADMDSQDFGKTLPETQESLAPDKDQSLDQNEKSIIGPEDSSPIEITIDIDPDDEENLIDLVDDKSLTVALIGTDDFDVNDINHETLTLGDIKPDGNFKMEDVNEDGTMDLVAEFPAEGLVAFKGDQELTLRGKTKDGKFFEGKDSVTFGQDKQ